MYALGQSPSKLILDNFILIFDCCMGIRQENAMTTNNLSAYIRTYKRGVTSGFCNTHTSGCLRCRDEKEGSAQQATGQLQVHRGTPRRDRQVDCPHAANGNGGSHDRRRATSETRQALAPSEDKVNYPSRDEQVGSEQNCITGAEAAKSFAGPCLQTRTSGEGA